MALKQITLEEQISRIKELMGTKNESVKPSNVNPTGIIERVERGKDGITYAIIKENNKYYLKKSPKLKDLTAGDFEYLGGSHTYRSLYEYSSYNNAEKVLKEELYNISKSVDKKSIIQEEAERIDNNLIQTVDSKEMRSEIDRQRQIMSNAAKILGENSGISERKGKINELSIGDESILTDDSDPDLPLDGEEVSVEGDTPISLDNEFSNGEEGDIDVSDEELERKDIGLDQQLVDEMPDLGDKIDSLESEIKRLNALLSNSDLGDNLGDNLGDEGDVEGDEFDLDPVDEAYGLDEAVESTVEVSDSGAGEGSTTGAGLGNNRAVSATKEEGYEDIGQDPDYRNTLPDLKSEGEIDIKDEPEDTLPLVKQTGAVKDYGEVKDGGDSEFNIHQKVEEGKTYYVVEGNGTVVGTWKKGKKAPVKNDPDKPFTEKVDLLTDSIFNECVKMGIFNPKKKI